MEQNKVVKVAAVVQAALVGDPVPGCIGRGKDRLRDIAGLQDAGQTCKQAHGLITVSQPYLL